MGVVAPTIQLRGAWEYHDTADTINGQFWTGMFKSAAAQSVTDGLLRERLARKDLEPVLTYQSCTHQNCFHLT